jgi:tetratricopeptide (TPR) repeat protein
MPPCNPSQKSTKVLFVEQAGFSGFDATMKVFIRISPLALIVLLSAVGLSYGQDWIIKMKVDLAKAHYNQGVKYQRNGQDGEAISEYTKAIEIDPDFAEAYYARGFAYAHGQGEYGKAILDFTKAIVLAPTPEAYIGRGAAYRQKDEIDRAIADFSTAIQMDPGDGTAHYHRAAAYASKGEYDRAWEDIQEAKSLGYAVDPQFWEGLGKAAGKEE